MKRFVYLFIFSVIFTLQSCKSTASQDNEGTVIEFSTTEGNFSVFLFNETSKHKRNMIEMVKSDFYKDILFHRVISGFVIQAGDPDTKNPEPDKLYGAKSGGTEVSPEFIPAKFDHIKGALGAARNADMVNPGKLSSGSHFYIVTGGNSVTDEEIYNSEKRMGVTYDPKVAAYYRKSGGTPHLDGEYTVFGYVCDGMETVDKIAAMEKDKNDRPKKDIKITGTRIITLNEAETAEKYNGYAK